MNERTKELAEQAGLKFSKDWGECYTGNVQIERFAELVRQDEREACAKLCDSIGAEWHSTGVRECAAAIRGRTDPKSDFKTQMDDNWSGII